MNKKRKACLTFPSVSYRNAETMIHLLKISLGTGILAMPQAIYHAGYILGSIGTIAIGFICVYSLHILLKSHHELCRRTKVLFEMSTVK